MNPDYLNQSLVRYRNMNSEHMIFHNIALGMPDRMSRAACDGLLEKGQDATLRDKKNRAIFLVGIAYNYAAYGGLGPEENNACSRKMIGEIEAAGDKRIIADRFFDGLIDYAQQVKRVNGFENLSRDVRRAINYVIDHINETMLLKEVCREIGLSPDYLSRELKRQTGYSFPQMVNHAKILKARTLLETTDRSVTEIACQLSFSSPNQFATSFKKACGMTPAEYRKAYRS